MERHRPAMLSTLETYYDTAPRVASRAVRHGPFTLFVSTGLWPYYARPRLGSRAEITADDVSSARARQRELGMPETFEWVHETTPSLAAAAAAAGLRVHRHPLLVLDGFRPAAPPDGARVRLLDAEDPALPAARGVASVGFAVPGTDRGAAGPAERDRRAAADPDAVAYLGHRIAAGLTVIAVAEVDGEVLAVGSHNPIDGVTEIVGVATLPAARRRGLAAAVTAKLVEQATAEGAGTVFLSADDDVVARVYERLGFVRVGTACTAGPPDATEPPG